MMGPNPYNYNLPVTEKMFFGRQMDVETLAHQLTIGQGDSILLIGGRRMGKTSLLEALYRVLQARAKKPTQSLMPLPVLLDLMGEGVDSLASFFHMVCERSKIAIEETLSQPLNTTCTCREGELPLQIFQNALAAWAQTALREHNHRLRLILLLDECEEIFERPWAHELQGALRSLLNGRKTRDLLKVVMAGSHRLLVQTKQRGSPLWNVLIPHRLHVFESQATYELIMKPTKGCLSDETVRAITSQSGGHAFLIQYIMYHLWEQGLKGATPQIVQKIASSFPKERSDFRDWTNSLGTSGLMVYDLLVRTNSPLAEGTILNNSSIAHLDVADALDTLCYLGLVMKETNREGYQVAGQMFREWFITYREEHKRN